MLENRGATVGWVVGGVPLIASALRAGSVLTGTNLVNYIPVVDTVHDALLQLTIFRVSQAIAFRQVELVSGLFVVLFLGWITLGVLMSKNVRRRVASAYAIAAGAVGAVSVMYALLYLGVYNGLLTGEYPLAQQLLFFSVPVASAASLVGAFRLYSWDDPRYSDAISRIHDAESNARDKRQTFERTLHSEVGGDPARVTGFELDSEFVDNCERVVEEASDYTSASVTSDVYDLDNDEIEREATRIEQLEERLDPTAEVKRIRSEFRAELDRRVSEQLQPHDDLRTPDGEPFELENLDGAYSVLETAGLRLQLSGDEPSAGDQITTAVEENRLTLFDAFGAVQDAADHLQHEVEPHLAAVTATLRPHVTSWEAVGADSGEADGPDTVVEGGLATVEERFEGMTGATGTTLRKIYLQGDEVATVVTVPEARSALDEARTALRECRLDHVTASLETAVDHTDALLTASDIFVNKIPRRLEKQLTPFPILGERSTPSPVFTEAVYRKVVDALEADFGVDAHVDWDTQEIHLTYPDTSTEIGATTARSGRPSGTGTSTDDGDTAGGTDLAYRVKVLVKALREDARRGDEASLDRGSLPPLIDDRVVETFLAFVRDHDELATESSVEDDGLVVTAASGRALDRVATEILDDFTAWTERPNSTMTTAESEI